MLALIWAVYPRPEGPVMTAQADRVFFDLLLVLVVSPQLAFYSLIDWLTLVIGEGLRVWLLRYAGLIFSVGHVIYLKISRKTRPSP